MSLQDAELKVDITEADEVKDLHRSDKSAEGAAASKEPDDGRTLLELRL